MADISLPYIVRPGQPTCDTCRFAQVIRVEGYAIGYPAVECRYGPPRNGGFSICNGGLTWCGKHEAIA